jgi:uncharacterized delta-60 repeat protein
MKTRTTILAATIAASFAGAAVGAAPDDGRLDETWSFDGKAFVGFNLGGGNNDSAWSVVAREDGTSYLAGIIESPNGFKIGVAKRDALGEPDDEFSGDGQNQSLLSGVVGRVKAVVGGDTTSYLYVAATRVVNGDDTDIVLCRFGAEGGNNIDFTGGDTVQGCVTAPLTLGVQRLADLLIQPDGKLIVVGTTAALAAPAEKFVYAARFNPDGSHDNSFASVPLRNTAVFSSHEPRGAVLASNGKIVIAGEYSSAITGSTGGLVMRLNSDGTLDPLGPNGEAGFPIASGLSSVASFQDLVLEPVAGGEDAVVAVGHAEFQAGERSAVIARMSGNPLSLDETFGSEGGYSVQEADVDISYETVASHPCAGYVVAMSAPAEDDLSNIIVNAYSRSGQVNAAFGETLGFTVIDGAPAVDQADLVSDISVAGDGVFIAGRSLLPLNAEFAGAKLFMDSLFCSDYEKN